MLKISELHKSFNTGNGRNIDVLSDISFEINEGEFVILLGANGSGKSTLLRLLSGELFPDKGQIFFENNDISKEPAFKRASYIAKISQLRENNLPDTLTINEVLSLAKNSDCSLFSFIGNKNQKKAVVNLLNNFKPELTSHIEEQVKVLSGGEHQIISLLTAFMLIKEFKNKNRILLLDEHISNLDINSANMVMEATQKIIVENSLTALMVTHNLEIASKYGNRVIILRDMQIVYDKSFKQGELKNTNDFYDIIFK
jgi:putative tryptophan/tyrosine transport system ATP-binding protein